MKILIVDDNKENIDLLEVLLTNSSYAVSSSKNGKEALKMLRAEKFDLIISDILMPVMDGFQFCRECRKDNKLKSIPFIFYTATYVDKKDEEFALSLGAQSFIRKPKEPDEFLKIIKSIVEGTDEKIIKHTTPTMEDEKEVLKLYNERLVNKLEKKMMDLENEVVRRRKAEKELSDLNTKLEQKIAEKTKELEKKIYHLEIFHTAAVNRELKMEELRVRIRELEEILSKKDDE